MRETRNSLTAHSMLDQNSGQTQNLNPHATACNPSIPKTQRQRSNEVDNFMNPPPVPRTTIKYETKPKTKIMCCFAFGEPRGKWGGGGSAAKRGSNIG
eukprot:2690158-Amphidinium_carterae.1